MTVAIRRSAAILAGLAVALGGLCAAPDARADDVITLGSQTAYQSSAVAPQATVAYQLPASADDSWHTVYIERQVNGIWTQYDSAWNRGRSGTVQTFGSSHKKEAAGTWQFRLRIEDPVAVSAPYTVQLDAAPTTIGLGSTALSGSDVVFKSYHFDFTFNDPYYEAKKSFSVEFPTAVGEYANISLQRLDAGQWLEVSSYRSYVSTGSSGVSLEATITQNTPAKTSYRFVVPATDWTTGATSDTFTVTGQKQSPSLSVSYSASKQKYKKSAVTLTATTKIAHTGKITVYDGKKKLRSVTVNYSKAKYTLSKKLKKGTHKIKVKFTPSADYAPFFNSATSKVKKIKVK
ncbi:MAG: hypothetical protein LBR32_03160 [Propionibacteriaceae bacterium]|jgi:hypothetical protein|nr:hypothetical protein [Propionibacteriaceae bacterium]